MKIEIDWWGTREELAADLNSPTCNIDAFNVNGPAGGAAQAFVNGPSNVLIPFLKRHEYSLDNIR